MGLRAPFTGGLGTVTGRTPAHLRRWQAALAKLLAGLHRPKIVFIGDSKRYGMGAGTDSANVWSTAAEPRSMPAHLVRLLAARGVPASRQATIGTGGVSSPAAKTAYDPRIVATGWGAGNQSLGGPFWKNGGTEPFVFTPEGSIDMFDVYTRIRSGDGTLTATIDTDPTVLATIVGNGAADGFRKTTIAVPRGAHTLKLQRTTGGFVALAGIVAKDASESVREVMMCVRYGARGS